MNARTGVWASVIAILVLAGVIVFGFKGFSATPRYTIADNYIEDSNPMNKVVFHFVDIESLDTALIKKISTGFKNQYLSKIKGQPQTKPVTVMVTQFYRQEDAGSLTPQAMQSMGIPPQMIAPIAAKLQYVPREKGFMNVDFIQHAPVPGMQLPPSNLAQSPILGPKPGFKMQELIRQLTPPAGRQ